MWGDKLRMPGVLCDPTTEASLCSKSGPSPCWLSDPDRSQTDLFPRLESGDENIQYLLHSVVRGLELLIILL